jgi:transcriptional regulator with GAF, ATPase, and Fis domain
MALRPRRTMARPSADEPTSMAVVERQHIMRALAFTRGQIEGDGGAAALLGLKPSTLRTRMDKQRITRAAALLAGLPRVLPDDWRISAMERQHIARVLAGTDGRIEGPRGAAVLLGLKPSTLRTRIQRLRRDR